MASLFDKRECRLELTQKYYDRARLNEDSLKNVLRKVSKQFSEEELALLSRLLDSVSDELGAGRPSKSGIRRLTLCPIRWVRTLRINQNAYPIIMIVNENEGNLQ